MKSINTIFCFSALMLFVLNGLFASNKDYSKQCENYYYASYHDGYVTKARTGEQLNEFGFVNNVLVIDFQQALISKDEVTLLDLSGQVHQNYFQGISQLKELEYLNLSEIKNASWGNFITELPWEVYYIRSLKTLIANNNSLHTIPSEICNLNNLSVLSLSGGIVEVLPKELMLLSNLEILDLSNNRIQAIPSNINKLSNLEVLLLDGNDISEVLPAELSSLTNLKVLSIQFSKNMSSADLQKSLEIIASIENLEVLHIRNSRIVDLPECLANLGSLSNLSLRGNIDINLKSAFEVCSQMQSLRVLDISFCGLTKLPKEIGLMAQLEVLYAGNNKLLGERFIEDYANNITKLPNTISNCSALKAVYLWNNNLNHEKVAFNLAEVLNTCIIEVKPFSEQDIAAN
jgi:Leucine-rich repeat (LRR) protein